MSEYLLKSELARLMKVHHSTVVRAIQRGQIKTVPLLGRQVIAREEARRLLEPLGIPLDGRDKK